MLVVRLVVLMALFASTADAVVLCAKPKKNGTFSTAVKIRETCKPGETTLDTAALGLQGPPGTPGPALRVRDAVGTFVGIVSHASSLRGALNPLSSEVMIAFAEGASSGLLKVTPGGFVANTTTAQLFYKTADCSGTAYLAGNAPTATLIQTAPVLPSPQRAFLQTAPFEFFDYGSVEVVGQDFLPCAGTIRPPDRCCIVANCGTATCQGSGAPVVEADLSRFVLPLKLDIPG